VSSGVQNALEGWVRGMEACKSEQEGLKREKEEQLYESLEGLKSELDAYRNRTSSLDGGSTPRVNCLPVQQS
jgi:hypothetical protein